jgi:hypothetical protein
VKLVRQYGEEEEEEEEEEEFVDRHTFRIFIALSKSAAVEEKGLPNFTNATNETKRE